MLTEIINPIQLVEIKIAEIDSIKIFLKERKIAKNSLIFPKKIIIKKSRINDHNPRWLAISKAGIYLISLKINGCGIPQNVEAKQVKKIPL